MSVFSRFPPRLQEAIVARLGWSSLRPVQELAGEAILSGKNAIVLAPTAGGKTEASMFPVIAQMVDDEPKGVGVIYIAPLKALLNNQAERLGLYTEMVGLSRFVWHGDAKDGDKRRFLAEPTELLMTTPESLEVMLLSSRVPTQRLFADVRAVVIDEVHAMAGTDRGAHLMSVLERVFRFTENDVQRIGLSATVGNPVEILAWLQGTSKREGVVIDPPKVPSRKDLKVLLRPSILAIAQEASKDAQASKSLFFCQSRALAESLAERMRLGRTEVFVHHSSVSAEERAEAEKMFHHGGDVCIVCTSTLELGIDVGDLDLVLQANAPSTVSSFLQRLGRTGRRQGLAANTTFYCEDPEVVVQASAIIELAKRGWVESVPPQTRSWPVLVHQLLALTLQFGAVSAERAWEQLSRVPDFSDITRPEFDRLVAHLLAEGYLFASAGQLSMGETAERVFGRKNFMELYAVFSSPLLYKVKTEAGHSVGSLEQDFVDKLVADMSSFLLGGRAWVVSHINHEEKTVRVNPAPRGKKPTWGGFSPQLLGYELCQQIATLLKGTERLSYLDDAAHVALSAARSELGPLLQQPGLVFQYDDDRTLWWTYAGGRINHTLKYGLQAQLGVNVVADNFMLRIEGIARQSEAIVAAIEAMAQDSFWRAPDTRNWILSQLPEYRLSKFQRALPRDFAMELVGAYLLDFEGASQFLRDRMVGRNALHASS